MNLQLSLIYIVYNSFDIFFKAINTYVVTERFVFINKRDKKWKKKILCKVWLKYDKTNLTKQKKIEYNKY